MTLNEFIAKYDGKGIDFDGHFGAQCVDLYRQYVKEVLGFPQSPPVAGAKDIWDTYLPDYYKRVENTPYGVPEAGDIVIFSSGTYGHVSIFLEGNTSRFTSFDQNYPSGTLCHKQGHTYSGVIGWLKPLIKNIEDMPDYFKTLLNEAGLDINKEGEFRAFWEKALKYDDTINDLREQIKSANEKLSETSAQVSMYVDKVQSLDAKVQELQESLNKARDERDKATWEVSKVEAENRGLKEDNEVLLGKVSDLEAKVKELNTKILTNVSWWVRFFSLFKRK